ncbi:MAG: hypothetical protein NT007_11155 [Candidatus Kapabacteria bacterium]|nr:hypothetical protein [Candidatus Kapabacteria bacterium]
MPLMIYSLILILSFQLSTMSEINSVLKNQNGDLIIIYFCNTSQCVHCFDIDKNSVIYALDFIKNKKYAKKVKAISCVECTREIEFRNYKKTLNFLPFVIWNKGKVFDELKIPSTTAVAIIDNNGKVLATFDYQIRTGFSKEICKIIAKYFK